MTGRALSEGDSPPGAAAPGSAWRGRRVELVVAAADARSRSAPGFRARQAVVWRFEPVCL